MREIRMVLCWIFAAACVLNLAVVLRCEQYAIRYNYPPSLLRDLIISAVISAAVALCSGVAWWTVWKKRASAKGWAIAASATSIIIFVRPFILPTRPVWDHHLGALIIGIVGLVAFLWPETSQFQRWS